ncbi:MAG: BamA/TamA family outer membrane protein [Candidatus Krumholzibacteria bacterium]|nr:BamA/TamA family outer membrane protein [Candidatus Krumholzibacteria bacterium]
MRTGRIYVHGNERVKTTIILREIPLAKGDPFDYGKLQEGRRNVARVPGVDYSEIRVVYLPDDSSLGLNVIVTEKRTLEGNLWLERGYENEISIGGSTTEYNLRGRSERLAVSFLAIRNIVLGADWENPWVWGGWKVGLGARVYYITYDYPYDDFDNAFAGMSVWRLGGEVEAFHPAGKRSRVYVKAGYEAAGGDEGVTLDPGGDAFVTMGIGARWDGRDSERFAWSGGYLLAEMRAVGPFQEGLGIVEAELDARAFVAPFSRLVLAAQARAVVRDGDAIPIYRREHVGGGLTLRGYDYGAFDGDNALHGGAELRVPLNFSRERPLEDILLGLEVHAFADFGAAWNGPEPLEGERLRGGYGVGAAILNRQVRGLRFDYGWPRDGDGRFHFEIGLKF